MAGAAPRARSRPMKLYAVLLASIFAFPMTSIAAAPPRLKSFSWHDRIIANYAQLAEVVRGIDSVKEADDLIEAAWLRGNSTATLGMVLDDLAPADQDHFVANFRIDHPILGNHAYSRRVEPAYRAELERLVGMGLPIEDVRTLVGYVPAIYGFGLTVLREQMNAFEGEHVDLWEALKWAINAESKSEGRRGIGSGYRQEMLMMKFVSLSARLEDTDKQIQMDTKYRQPIDELLNKRARIVRRLARYGSDPKTIEQARRRGIELEIADVLKRQKTADDYVERARSDFGLAQALHNDRFVVRFGLVQPKTAEFDPDSARDQVAELARAARLTELRAELETLCSAMLERVINGGARSGPAND